jgi:hypothetical protein
LIRAVCNLKGDKRQECVAGRETIFIYAFPAWNDPAASRPGDIGAGEIAAFEQEPRAMNLGAGVGQAIAEIQQRLAATFAVALEGATASGP